MYRIERLTERAKAKGQLGIYIIVTKTSKDSLQSDRYIYGEMVGDYDLYDPQLARQVCSRVMLNLIDEGMVESTIQISLIGDTVTQLPALPHRGNPLPPGYLGIWID